MTAALDRRSLLRGAIALGGALIVPVAGARAQDATTAGAFQPSAFIRIDKDDVATIFLPKSEMGQGINTSIPMIVAEELDLDLDRVKVAFAPPGTTGKIWQSTGGSNSTQSTTAPLQEAGAKARAMLVQAAAARWGVPPEACATKDGKVLHAPSRRALAYGELVEAAARLPVPETAKPKAPQDYRLVGKPRRRLDAASKVDGSAVFGIDAAPAGVKVAAIIGCPVIGGTLRDVDAAPALAIKGIRKVVKLEAAVAVIADHTGAARAALTALAPEWNLGPNADQSHDDIVAALRDASLSPGLVAHETGDANAAIASAAKRVEAVYEMPFLAHAPMEPINCTAHVTKDGCEVWIGHQSPVQAREAAAKASGLPVEKVTLHNHVMGGGFGRKVEVDMVDQAVRIAMTVDYPVKLIWSREEDIQQDFYRPFYVDRLAAGLDAAGKPVGWTHRITGSSLIGRTFPSFLETSKGVDVDATEGAKTNYALPALRIEYVRKETAVRTGFWRGVGATHNSFVTESFIDECAHAAGADPAAYRRALIAEPRLLAVLDLACEKAGWGSPLAKGRGRGISVQSTWHTMMAQVVEIEVGDDGTLKLHRVVCAVDCGQMINPQTVRAQCEGGIVFGLGAALREEITIAEGRVVQSNFSDYTPLRMNEVPVIETYLVENHEPSGGMGEAPTACVGPALTNAIFAATGKRIRQLPVAKAGFNLG